MQLRDVLNAFEQNGPTSLAQMSRALDVEPSALDGMIQFWVRKGKLRAVCDMGCSSCGVQSSCPICVATPRRYELVTDDGASAQAKPAQEPPRHSCCH